MEHFKKARTALSLILAASLSACVNNIGENEIQESNIPISFVAKSEKGTTRASKEVFSSGDKIGIFAMLSGTALDGQRYINNLRLDAGEGSNLIPQKEVYYPEGDATLDFVSYYPYQTGGIPEGAATLNIAVKTDQSTAENYALSDFMTAKTANITNSAKSVTLEYGHKLAKIKVVLVPQGEESADDMLKANPRIIATGFKTQAVYDLNADKLTEIIEESEADITPYGEWAKGTDGTLTGKEFIVIPQTHADHEHGFSLEWNGKVYTCSTISEVIPENTEVEIRINAQQSTSTSLTGVVASISQWGKSQEGTGQSSYNINAIHTAALAFENSEVYRAYHQGKPVAEICREYLISLSGDAISDQAIVVYPVGSDEQTDQTQGTVLQLTNKKDELVHGGTVRWDMENNTLTYTAGEAKPIEKFYIDGNGEISFEKPENALAVNVSSYTLRDIREGVLKAYPIVKVGTQYWMQEDLYTDSYNDNQSIPLLEELAPGEGYFDWADKGFRLYNGDAVLTGKMSPEGWKIPNHAEWEKLVNYANDNAAILKDAEVWYTERSPATNETGLSIAANGMFLERSGAGLLVNNGQSSAYWVYNDTENTIEEAVLFLFTNEKISFTTNINNETRGGYAGLSIRCIKE